NNNNNDETQLQPVFNAKEYNKNKEKALRVAIAVLITRDPGVRGGFLDSAGALVVSIIEAQSVHNITLIALIHTNVTRCVPILKVFGYQIRSYDVSFKCNFNTAYTYTHMCMFVYVYVDLYENISNAYNNNNTKKASF
ncbi:hypothetical protein RFI_09765, partial [Reticulomyxa filosa]